MAPAPPDPAWWKDAAPEQWNGLRRQLRERRAKIAPRFYNRTQFSKERGIHYKLAFDVEQGPRRNFDPDTLQAIAAAYAVTYESVLGAFGGGELIPVQPGEPAPAEARPPSQGRRLPVLYEGVDEAALAPYMRDVQAQLLDAIDRCGPDPPGAEIFANADEAAAWDGGARRLPTGNPLLSRDERVRSIALDRLRADEARRAGLRRRNIARYVT